ncbi:hypothetical protein GIW81_18080 [Hyphomicrobium sp. xq]|uniref:Uncharacterized protein n=1 Tax=Hyphomicrobium album TaxID=2665159 RepID=A0A6I3KQY7_9HYPH|nr:hypothetical protein [Hyphomicrobium album]MTD96252.1 hypothetical protein [Hyphomicrobium album]
MMIHGNETLQPEELTQLGVVFDEVWAEFSDTAGQENTELRTFLASILLRLANLKQLGPEQMKATALRIIRGEAIQDTHSDAPLAEIECPSSLAEERQGCSAPAAIPSAPQGA